MADSESTDAAPGGAAVADLGAATALVEIEPGLAVLYGDHVPDGIEVTPFALIDDRTQASLSDAIAKATGLGNLAAQGVNGAMQAQGLVRLAPETLKLLQTARPLTNAGWNLGTLASEGKIVAQVRWLPAAGASAASVVAALGPAIVMLAIQFQLSAIADLAKRNIELTSLVLEESRHQRRAAVTGYHRTLAEMVGHASDVGAVTPAIFKEVRGYKGPVAAQWDGVRAVLQSHVTRLQSKRGNKDRRQYLLDNGEAILADAHAFLMAQASWFMYQALWAGHLQNTAEENSKDAELLTKIIRDTRRLHDRSLLESDWLLDQLSREFSILAELDGKKTFKIGGEYRAGKDVARMAVQLRRSLADIRAQDAGPEPTTLPAPTVSAFEDVPPEVLLKVLSFRLEPGERLAALASAWTSSWSASRWIAVTDKRVLFMNPDDFRRYAAIDWQMSVQDIRFVRVRDRGKDKGPGIDLISKDKDITLEFRSWAKDGERARQAQRFGEVLATFMNLPPDEVPTTGVRELKSPVGDESGTA